MPHARPAFSLAELMIALIILGLGLLFIAAALPVGLSYTRDTIDLAAGEAAAEYALDTIEQYLRTSDNLVITMGDGTERRADNLFRPRKPPTDPNDPLGFDGTMEPSVKVRPLIADNIDATAGADLTSTIARSDLGEELIRAWLSLVGAATDLSEVDYAVTGPWGQRSLYSQPALPPVARVYPPVSPLFPFQTTHFFATDLGDQYYWKYAARGDSTYGVYPNELRKALDRRVTWTAFYRRVSYDPGPDGTLGNADDTSDPLLYEVIVVVVRRPSVNHRFPRQNPGAGFNTPSAVVADSLGIGLDRLAPVPWLVTFNPNPPAGYPPPLPLLTPVTDYDNTIGGERPITNLSLTEPPSRFICTEEVGRLLPLGSIFISAVNDDRPGGDATNRHAGFVPHAPDALPIYEVVERPDEYTVVVKNNGFYPWVYTNNPEETHLWPVWVLPPAFRERDSTGQPVYERRSPILAVARRYIRLREID